MIDFPSGVKTAHCRLRAWPFKVATLLAVSTSHIRAAPSSLAVTTYLPSGLNDALLVLGRSPSRSSATTLPLSATQTSALPSSLAVTTHFPLGLKATLVKGLL